MSATCRNENGATQQPVANRCGITDQAHGEIYLHPSNLRTSAWIWHGFALLRASKISYVEALEEFLSFASRGLSPSH